MAILPRHYNLTLHVGQGEQARPFGALQELRVR
jgi:hypothetical protein